MTISCSACNTEYNLDPSKIPSQGGFFKCRKCGEKVQLPVAKPEGKPLAREGSSSDQPQASSKQNAPTPTAPVIPALDDAAIPLGDSDDIMELDEADALPIELDAGAPTGAEKQVIPLDPAPTTKAPVIALDPAPTTKTSAIALDPAPTTKTPAIALDPAPTTKTPAIALDSAPTTKAPAIALDPAPTTKAPAIALDPAPTTKTPAIALDSAPTASEDDLLPTPSAAPNTPASSHKRLGDLADLPLPADGDALDGGENLPDMGLLPDLPAPTSPSLAEQAPIDVASLPELADLPSDDELAALAPDALPALDDLPAAAGAQADAIDLDLDDLPAPNQQDAVPTANADRATPGLSIELADLPAAATSIDLDLPATPLASPPEDHSAPDTAAEADTSAFEFSVADGGTLELELGTPADLPASANVQAPNLMDELPVAVSTQATPSPALLGESTETISSAPSTEAQAPQRHASRSIALALVSMVLILAAAAYGAWELGYLQPYLKIARGEIAHADPLESAPSQATRPPPAEQPSNETLANEPVKKKDEPPVPLTAENVDRLSYAQLKASTQQLVASGTPTAAKDFELALWGFFRLGSTFEDRAAKTWLLEHTPQATSRLKEFSPLGLAACAGALVLEGKLPQARQLLKRHKPRKKPVAPHIEWVEALTYTRRNEARRAVQELRKLAAKQPHWLDVGLRLAHWLWWTEKTPALAMQVWTSAAAEHSEAAPFIAVQAIDRLLQNDHHVAAAGWGAYLGSLEEKRQMPPELHQKFYAYQASLHAWHGKLQGTHAALLAAAEDGTLADHLKLARMEGWNEATRERLKTLGATLDSLEQATLQVEAIRLALAASNRRDASDLFAKLKEATLPLSAQGWVRLAEGMLAQFDGELAKAQAAYQAAMRSTGSSEPAKLALALLHTAPADALPKLSQLNKSTSLPAVEFYLGVAMLQRNNLEGARRRFEKLMWNDPTFPSPVELVFARADALSIGDNAATALELLENLRSSLPRDERVLLGMARRAAQQEHFETASKWYAELVALAPAEPAYRVALAKAYNDANESLRAQKSLDDLLQAYPEARSPGVLAQLGRAWAERDPVKARGYFQEALEQAPESATFVLVGNLEYQLSRYDEARQAYTQAIKTDGANVTARIRLGRVLLVQEQLQQAAKVLQEALRLAPTNNEAAQLLGETLESLGDIRGAVTALQSAAAGDTPTPSVLMALARLQLHHQGAIAPATKTLRRLLSIAPKHVEAHYYLGLAYKDLGRPAEARNYLQGYLSLAPEGELAGEVTRVLADLQR